MERSEDSSESANSLELRITHAGQLFETLDPSPFWDRDLDQDAANYIEHAYVAATGDPPKTIRVLVPESERHNVSHFEGALKAYFTREAESARYELREHLRMALIGLGAAIVFWIFAIGLHQWLSKVWNPLPLVLNEGLIVIAWVALWRPAEELIYGWLPVFRRIRRLQALAQLRVDIVS